MLQAHLETQVFSCPCAPCLSPELYVSFHLIEWNPAQDIGIRSFIISFPENAPRHLLT